MQSVETDGRQSPEVGLSGALEVALGEELLRRRSGRETVDVHRHRNGPHWLRCNAGRSVDHALLALWWRTRLVKAVGDLCREHAAGASAAAAFGDERGRSHPIALRPVSGVA